MEGRQQFASEREDGYWKMMLWFGEGTTGLGKGQWVSNRYQGRGLVCGEVCVKFQGSWEKLLRKATRRRRVKSEFWVDIKYSLQKQNEHWGT